MKDEDYFEYLTELRDGGSINMMEAPRLLESEYGLSNGDARRIFLAWIESFKQSA
tara:strand:- start:762 stop:926 length:165 start_codon:yes stop_codon:yes gene_type:complete